MTQVVSILLRICCLKGSPADLPSSMGLLYRFALLMIINRIIILRLSQSMDTAELIFFVVCHTLILGLVTYLLLHLFKHKERWLQTVTAIYGIETLASIPLVAITLIAPEMLFKDGQPYAHPLLLIIEIWSFVIKIRILKTALSVSTGMAVLLSFVSEMVIFISLVAIFPGIISGG